MKRGSSGCVRVMVSSKTQPKQEEKNEARQNRGGKIMCNCLRMMIKIQENDSLLMHFLADKPNNQQTNFALRFLYPQFDHQFQLLLWWLLDCHLCHQPGLLLGIHFLLHHIHHPPVKFRLTTPKRNTKKQNRKQNLPVILANFTTWVQRRKKNSQ